MFTEIRLRQLAKSNKFQNLLIANKELHGIYLFKNKIDFTKIQEVFLSYLFLYHDILNDINLKKIDKFIINDDIYVDAYSLWKQEKDDNKSDNKKKSKNLKLVFSK